MNEPVYFPPIPAAFRSDWRWGSNSDGMDILVKQYYHLKIVGWYCDVNNL